MKKPKTFYNIKMKLSDKIAFGIVTGYSVFHLLILLGIIPQNIVWGGKIIEPKTILYLEFAALFIMLFLGFLILVKTKIVQWNWQVKTINRWLFVFSIYFLLNTFTNVLAETTFEKAQAIITIILAISLFNLSKRKL
ncbi:hypothetical protein [Algibacter pacificus]|uniref:hypothetical protein n=1 Tax=Algibacter pacificus TaxID=2599389 RepID=UPI0011CBCF27|nr:hypothetical protein [Algibacter pacificus]